MSSTEQDQTIEHTIQDTILIVGQDEEVCARLVDLMENVGGYATVSTASFEEGLAAILLQPFALAIIQIQLPDLSGVDLLTAVSSLCPHLPVILIDDNLSAKSAVAAFRLGAIDYISQPINYDFLLMRVDWELKYARAPQAPPPSPILPYRHYSPQDRERRLNPKTRSAALTLKRSQFLYIAAELQALQTRVQAKFVGLVDSDENLIGAAGTLEDWNLRLFRKALTIEPAASENLLAILGETSFNSTFFEGDHNTIYVTRFGHPHPVNLVVICPVVVKPGIAWFYSKQVANAIEKILKSEERT